MDIAVGLVLLALGAVGAAATTRTVGDDARPWLHAVAVAPMGLLVGTGAAMVRDWDLVPTAIAGAVLLPIVALVTRLRVRRRGRVDS